MLNHAKSICITYQKNCDSCPIRLTCKRKIMLSREEVEAWINDLEIAAREVVFNDNRI